MWFFQGVFLMLEKYKESVDKGSEFGAFLTDLSEGFHWIDINCSWQNYSGMESHLHPVI